MDQAYAAAVREADAGRLEPIPKREVAIGNSVDRAVRQELQNLFKDDKIEYGKGKDIIMNNRDYDTSDPSKKDYRLPDLRIGEIAYDLSLTEKRSTDPQIRDFFDELRAMSERMRTHFEADSGNETDDTLKGRRLITEITDLLIQYLLAAKKPLS